MYSIQKITKSLKYILYKKVLWKKKKKKSSWSNQEIKFFGGEEKERFKEIREMC